MFTRAGMLDATFALQRGSAKELQSIGGPVSELTPADGESAATDHRPAYDG